MHNYKRNQGPKTFNDIMIKIKNKYFIYYGKTSDYILMYVFKTTNCTKHRTQFMRYNKLLNFGQTVVCTRIRVT